LPSPLPGRRYARGPLTCMQVVVVGHPWLPLAGLRRPTDGPARRRTRLFQPIPQPRCNRGGVSLMYPESRLVRPLEIQGIHGIHAPLTPQTSISSSQGIPRLPRPARAHYDRHRAPQRCSRRFLLETAEVGGLLGDPPTAGFGDPRPGPDRRPAAYKAAYADVSPALLPPKTALAVPHHAGVSVVVRDGCHAVSHP
jgi:hypothetical protein